MKIALIGYGKMGQLIHEIATERGHEVVCIIDPNAQAQTLSPTLSLIGQGRDAIEKLREADVAIEFTTPATAAENIRMAWEQGVPVVSGTTGWSVEELSLDSRFYVRPNSSSSETDAPCVAPPTPTDPSAGTQLFLRNSISAPLASNDAGCPKENGIRLVDEKGKVWLVWKSNFSVGVNVFFELNQRLAALLAEYGQYTPSITETHHIHKLDKPSGTAVTLAEGIHSLPPYSSTPLPPIESIREGEVAGIHTVVWDSPEDTITITHSAKSRRGFALGAVLAAEHLLVES